MRHILVLLALVGEPPSFILHWCGLSRALIAGGGICQLELFAAWSTAGAMRGRWYQKVVGG